MCVAVCCSVLQCVAVYYVAVCCSALCCSVLQCVAVRWHEEDFCSPRSRAYNVRVCCTCVAVSCSVLHVCCSVLQCVAVMECREQEFSNLKMSKAVLLAHICEESANQEAYDMTQCVARHDSLHTITGAQNKHGGLC